MTPAPPSIVGFRQDRVGARITGLLNVMRLARKFGVAARFHWLSQPSGPYPELADPAAFFDPEFVAAHMDVVNRAPDRATLRDLGAAAAQMNQPGFAAALARGERFQSDAAFDLTLFQGEPRAEVAAEMRAVLADLRLAPALVRALARVGARLDLDRRAPTALHVRRGDILDGKPWSYTQWPSKYVPDEFLRAFAAEQSGPVIAFSDTPAAVRHMARDDGRIVPVDDLLSDDITGGSLSTAQRDVLELMLMARCARVGAASSSAFSRAAQVVGGCEVVALPAGLPIDARLAAYDALLDRVIAAPDSFYAPGDLAQSTFFAANHAVTTGRVRELLDAFADRDRVKSRFPFVLRTLAHAAQSAGLADDALALARRGLTEKHIRRRDRAQCEQIVMLAQARQTAPARPTRGRAGDTPAPLPPGMHRKFVDQAFGAKASDHGTMAALGRVVLASGGRAGDQLLFPAEQVAAVDEPAPDAPDADTAPRVLPPWTYLADWEDLVGSDSRRRELRRWPGLDHKLSRVADRLATLETALAEGIAPPEPDDDVALALGFAAGKLALHGRLRRAFAVLTWLDRVRPGDALTAKRMADAYFQVGNGKKAWHWLDSAMTRAPDNALLQLSGAVRADAQGFPNRRAGHLAAALRLWPDLKLAQRLARQMDPDRKGGAKP